MNSDKPEEQELILDTVHYFNVLIQSIQNINNSIMQDKDARDAAENLLSDLPDTWSDEIKDKIFELSHQYDTTIEEQNKLLRKGTKESIKQEARNEIIHAQKDFSRGVKKTVISLLKSKGLLFNTRKALETGYHEFPAEMFNQVEEDD